MDKLINKANLERMIIALNERYEELVDNEKARAQSKEEEIAARAEEAINMLGGKSIIYISKEEYDEWRYHYSMKDSSGITASVDADH